MNLELKHLVPYLPYGLKVLNLSMHENGFRTKHSVKTLVVTASNLEIGLKDVDGIKYKPILRPISDLLKEIEIDGRKLTPQYEIDKVWRDRDYLKTGNLRYAPFWVFEQLIMWHFDFFGLIDMGLAISIHDVYNLDNK